MFSKLREDIAAIRQKDPAARSDWEVLTCYPGLHAVLVHRLSHWCWRADLKWLSRFISHVGRFLTGIEIHPGAKLGRRVFIDHGMGVVIGATAEVGDDCTIYQGVTLGGTSLTCCVKRHPTLEAGVIVGAGAQLLGGFTVGERAKIGSNAVVVKSVPAAAIVVGNPARVIAGAPAAKALRGAMGAPPIDAEFSAYGATPNADDPMLLAVQGLIDHVAVQSRKIEEMVTVLKRLGADLEHLQDTNCEIERLHKLAAGLQGK